MTDYQDAESEYALPTKDELQEILVGIMTPMAREITNLERLKRKEFLSPEEVEALYGIDAGTLANKRSRAEGFEFSKIGGKVFYPHKKLKSQIEKNCYKTRN